MKSAVGAIAWCLICGGPTLHLLISSVSRRHRFLQCTICFRVQSTPRPEAGAVERR